MNSLDRSSRRKVLIATSVVALLGALLVARSRRWGAVAEGTSLSIGGAITPAPAPVDLHDLTFPFWGCAGDESWLIQFRTNLDFLAPLGTGTENAARWFGDFAEPAGSRHREGESAMKRRVDRTDDLGKVLPPDDPLLLEAEPWCDQATMQFYPNVFPMRGADTQLPNLLLALSFAKSWVARGESLADSGRAMADFRRALRLGRLLRQEGTIPINDLVGNACIRFGAEGIYDLARRRGDAKLALAAALVLGEHSAQRFREAEKMTTVNLTRFAAGVDESHAAIEIPDRNIDEIVAVASKDPERRFRFEALMSLNLIRFLASPGQQARVAGALTVLAGAPDPIIAETAEWARDTPPSPNRLSQFFPSKN